MRRTVYMAGGSVALVLLFVAGCREEKAFARYEDPRSGIVRYRGKTSMAHAIPHVVRTRSSSRRQVVSRPVRSSVRRTSVVTTGRTTRAAYGFGSTSTISSPAEISVEADAAAVQRAEILLLSDMDVDLEAVPPVSPLATDRVTSRPVKTHRVISRITPKTTERRIAAASAPRTHDGFRNRRLRAPVVHESTVTTRTMSVSTSRIGPELEAGSGGVVTPGEYSTVRAAEVTISYAQPSVTGAPELDSTLSEIGWVDTKWVESRLPEKSVGRMAY